MSTCSTSGSVIDDRLLAAALREAMTSHVGHRGRIEVLARRPFAYQTSSPLEEITVRLDNEELTLLFKDLSPDAVRQISGNIKPPFLANACREIDAYSRVLQQADFGTAKYYGSIVMPASGRFGLFLELVTGRDLWQVGELKVWQQAAAWLGRFHRFWSLRCTELNRVAPRAIRCDTAHYRLWIDRAVAHVELSETMSNDERRSFLRLAQRFEQVTQRLTALPPTLLHGDFFASNVLIVGAGEQIRVCPVDWELNSIGPGLVDLAALVSGKWSETDRDALATSYLAAYDPRCSVDSMANLREPLAYCRLYLAVRMLGWASQWTPPPEHQHDWLRDALELGEQLGLLQ
jgi:Ser/Thr protein kinase RdoA (MazF antagonist)